ncbi:beta-ketoacyl synthase N-terminal-like domain-containing protein [Nocardia sp. NPDC046473]|uniref:type I polyketide synthase n=1 Tax=Nocardia sp. NPDC046473 TaxID=3155733 RepID=UPI0033E97A9E
MSALREDELVAPLTAAGDPVVIVGMACRFPGAVDLAGFWRLLLAGESAIEHAPSTGRRPGGYLSGVEHFDAEVFGMSAREAAVTDPQQRLLLELTWHALEDARIDPMSLRDSSTAVFVGACSDDYSSLLRAAGLEATVHTLTGVGRTFLANRISYVFGWHGPSLVIDTGQSSSLAALHQAQMAMLHGDCSIAIVAGVQLNLSTETDTMIEALGVLSPQGRCHVFDDRADGFVRGEGAGVVVLKKLSQALDDGDRAYCTILASAMTNDGHGAGITVPSAHAQQKALTLACARAHVRPHDVDYVELHGTGTRVGDPIEATALGGVYGRDRPRHTPLLVGSVKTNIGHLEAAAGVAGLIKTALSVYHRDLPASLNYQYPNPAIDLETLRLQVCSRRQTWPRPGNRVIAGVSSFGLGGTNCHVLVAAAPPSRPSRLALTAPSTPAAIVLSGTDAASLGRQALQLAQTLDEHPTIDVADLAVSLATTRAAQPYRGAIVATGTEGVRRQLRELSGQALSDAVVAGATRPGRTVFLLPGQGALRRDRSALGRALYERFDGFARPFDRACEAIINAGGADPKQVLWHHPTLVERIDHAQSALFAVEVAVCELLCSVGMVPDLLIGHSQGEIAAAYLAGVLSLDHAAALVVRRGQLLHSLPDGVMVAVQAAEHEIHDLVGHESDTVGLAAVNSPTSLVVSGEEQPVTELARHYAAKGRRTVRLRSPRACHSPMTAAIQQHLHEVAQGLTRHGPSGPDIVSTVTGRLADPAIFATPQYWATHLRTTVRFADAVTQAYRRGGRLFVELGPGAGLSTMVQECLAGSAFTSVAPMADEAETAGMMRVFAQAFVSGCSLNWPSIYPAARTIDLPHYSFRPDSYWFDHDLGDDQTRRHRDTDALTATLEPRNGVAVDFRASVIDCTLRALGRTAGDGLNLDLSFNDMGIDSRMAVEFQSTLSQAIGQPLPATLLFEYATPAALIDALDSGTAL